MLGDTYWRVRRNVRSRPFLADVVESRLNWAETYSGNAPPPVEFNHLEGSKKPGHVVATTVPFLYLFDPVARERATELGLSGLEFHGVKLRSRGQSDEHDGYCVAVVRGRVSRLRVCGLDRPTEHPPGDNVRVGGYEFSRGTTPPNCDFVTAGSGHLSFVSIRGRALLLDLAPSTFELTPISNVELVIPRRELEQLREAQRRLDDEPAADV